MIKYPKIQSLYKREEKGKHFLVDEAGNFIYSKPEFEFLENMEWEGIEKLDGTNVRIVFDRGTPVQFRGRTDNAQLPSMLLAKLHKIFDDMDIKKIITDAHEASITLYGEGIGVKIQKGGSNYNATDNDFVLFDILIENIWLTQESVRDIGKNLGLQVTPVVQYGNLRDLTEMVRDGFMSKWGKFYAEGIVMRPKIELCDRRRRRIISKLKTKDFTIINT